MTNFKKYRKHNKVYSLPAKVRDEIDKMLLDTSITYQDISDWLGKEHGESVSKSTIGRYALDTKKLAGRLLETQARVQELVKVAKQSKDEDLTEGALQIAVHKLSEKIALIEEELDELEPEKAIDLMIKLSRAKAYKDKVYADLKSEFELAYEQFKKAVYKELEDKYPEVAEKLVEIADQTLGKAYEK